MLTGGVCPSMVNAPASIATGTSTSKTCVWSPSRITTSPKRASALIGATSCASVRR
jgi:hypothetical protein